MPPTRRRPGRRSRRGSPARPAAPNPRGRAASRQVRLTRVRAGPGFASCSTAASRPANGTSGGDLDPPPAHQHPERAQAGPGVPVAAAGQAEVFAGDPDPLEVLPAGPASARPARGCRSSTRAPLDERRPRLCDPVGQAVAHAPPARQDRARAAAAASGTDPVRDLGAAERLARRGRRARRSRRAIWRRSSTRARRSSTAEVGARQALSCRADRRHRSAKV